MICCHSAIERPVFFSIDGKYDTGPFFGHGGAYPAMFTRSLPGPAVMRRAGPTDLIAVATDAAAHAADHIMTSRVHPAIC
jgi:hypothetical protein